jgi:hypothetical protein
MKRTEKSCDPSRLRVKSKLKFGCSIRRSNKRRSITELNPHSHTLRSIVSKKGRQANETIRSCGVVPSLKSASPSSSISCRNAGSLPAFLFGAPASLRGVPRPGFISVSGYRPDRSALFSDMRLSKRISGVAAATEPLHAPMNSPKAGGCAAPGGFLSNLVH